VSNSHGVAIPRDPLAVSVTGREEVGKRGGWKEDGRKKKKMGGRENNQNKCRCRSKKIASEK